MARKTIPPEHRRKLINLTIHPDFRAWAEELSRKRRRSLSQFFEDLVEAEWLRQQATAQNPPPPPPPPQPFFHQPAAYYYAPPQPPQTQQ